MKSIKVFLYAALSIGAIIGAVKLTAKVYSAKDLKSFHVNTSKKQTLAVVLAYTQAKNITNEERHLLREAERGFRDISEVSYGRAVSIKYTKVNLEKTPDLADEFKLSKNSTTAYVLLFKKGQYVTTLALTLTEGNSYKEIYNAVKNGIDENFGTFIDRLIQQEKEHRKEVELEQARAEKNYIVQDPRWDYYYNGYYSPFYQNSLFDNYGFYGRSVHHRYHH